MPRRDRGPHAAEQPSYLRLSADLCRTAGPFVLTRAVEMGCDIAAMTIYSRVSEAYDAAGSAITSSQLIVRSFFATFLFYIAPLVSGNEGDRLEISGILQAAWLFGLLLSIPPVLLAVFIRPILEGLEQPHETAILAEDFFRPYAMGILPILFIVANQQLLAGLKKTWIIFSITALTKPISTILTYFLMSESNRPLHSKSHGMGYANALSAGAGFLISTGYLLHLFPSARKGLHATRKQFKSLLFNGINIALYVFVELFSSTLNGILLGYKGEKTLAAFNPALQYASFIGMTTYAFGHMVGVMIKKANADGNSLKGIRYGKAGLAIALLLPLSLLTTFLINPNILIEPFIKNVTDTALMKEARFDLGVNLFGQFFETTRNVGVGILRGYAITRFPMWTNVVCTLLCHTIPASVAIYAFNSEGSSAVLARNAAIVLNTAVLAWKLHQTWKNEVPAPTRPTESTELLPRHSV